MKVLVPGLLLLTACATVSASLPNGTFSNVTYSEETGDLGGFQMETHLDGPNPTVVFTKCEGGCFGGKRWPVAIADDTISFTVVDEWISQGSGGVWHESMGLLGGQTVHHETTHFTARLSHGGWLLTSPDWPDVNARLRLQRDAEPGDTAELAEP